MREIKTSPYIPTNLELKILDNNKAEVVAYPFESGFAITLAHPLKRLLLSSTVGYAPTAIKISGIEHEFDTIKGVLEDAAILISNVKNLRFKIKDEESTRAEVKYSFSKKQELLGSSFVNDEVDVTLPENYVATLNDDANLEITIVIEKGIGYVPSEDLRDKVSKNFIPMDAFFTPVLKATYDIENVLVEDNPNFEKIIFQIQTDGQITPENAFKNALAIMNEQLVVFNQEMKIPKVKIAKVKNASNELDVLFTKIENLDIGTRGKNALSKSDFVYAAQVAMLSKDGLKSIKNLGKKSLEEIEQVMESLNYPVGYNFSDEQIEIINLKLTELQGIE
ncbi:MAG: DNA-directed RNA polymerase alpha subunit (EC [uncultured Campylobacterales bacterium]|uniref:DNA-directed RNA polymerase subunit alpha n=1 Tax=uncultured Campylobacterales bacterium TaxID=352960 RepID=A0A6S6SR95_9BACT|nr:MAG: DNA-directed RNA polymerase alpha subunit (EC [uncultured Campylobacterales bacterium]